MPELPEVETCVQGLKTHLENQVIESITVREPRLRWPIPASFADTMRNQLIHTVRRRAKYIILDLDVGHIIIHLGMSGSVRVLTPALTADTHDHVDIILKSNHMIRYNDPRRFGCILHVNEPLSEHKLFSQLGPEPLEKSFNARYLVGKCKNRKAAIKNIIMHNHIVVGVGNIYASEALFLSKIPPYMPAGLLSESQASRLVKHIKSVLKQAIRKGGTTLRDFVNTSGKPGYFQQSLYVYARENKACRVCETQLNLIKLGGRSSVYCPHCQRLP